MQSRQETHYGGFFVRLAAYLIDRLILLILLVPLMLILSVLRAVGLESALTQKVFFSVTPSDIILLIPRISYFVFLTHISGRTLGKWILHLKVVDQEGGRPSLIQILYRETVGRFLSGVLLGIGYLLIVVGDQKEALHDRLADTRVIYDWPESGKDDPEIVAIPKQIEPIMESPRKPEETLIEEDPIAQAEEPTGQEEKQTAQEESLAGQEDPIAQVGEPAGQEEKQTAQEENPVGQAE